MCPMDLPTKCPNFRLLVPPQKEQWQKMVQHTPFYPTHPDEFVPELPLKKILELPTSCLPFLILNLVNLLFYTSFC